MMLEQHSCKHLKFVCCFELGGHLLLCNLMSFISNVSRGDPDRQSSHVCRTLACCLSSGNVTQGMLMGLDTNTLSMQTVQCVQLYKGVTYVCCHLTASVYMYYLVALEALIRSVVVFVEWLFEDESFITCI